MHAHSTAHAEPSSRSAAELSRSAVAPSARATAPASDRLVQLAAVLQPASSSTAEPQAANRTGLPASLKAGIEQLSGQSLDHVRVHRNSAKPAQLNAHAYAQGGDIHLAPGQEKHLPHEAWHVAQQAQGRVRPTRQLKSVAINDDASLEREADIMGAKAATTAQRRAHRLERGARSPVAAAVAQLIRVAATVTGISHLVEIAGLSLYKGRQARAIFSGTRLLIETRGRYRSRRGPNQEVHSKTDKGGAHIYRWFPVVAVNGEGQPKGLFVREDAVRFGADKSDKVAPVPLEKAKYLSTEQIRSVLVPDRTIAMRAQNSGDMYHIRGAMISHPEYALLVWNVTKDTAKQAQQAIDLMEDLIRHGQRACYTDGLLPSGFHKTETTATKDITTHLGGPTLFTALDELAAGLPDDAFTPPRIRKPSPKDPPRKRGTPARPEFATVDQKRIARDIGLLKVNLGKAKGSPLLTGLQQLGRQGLIHEFAGQYGRYTQSEGKLFQEDLVKLGKFISGPSYVLVNFRSTGHSDRPGANAPALDTGTQGMVQLIAAVREALGTGVVVVPMGEEPKDHQGPNLLNYWNWPSAPDRRRQLSLIKYLADHFNIVGAVGMRSGVIDQLAFAGIRVISIDVTPHRTRRGGQVPFLGPSKGWDRGLKMEDVYGPAYGRVFLQHPRLQDTAKKIPKWAGAFAEPDRQAITRSIAFYFGGGATPTDYRDPTHPLHTTALTAALQRLPPVKGLSGYVLFNRMHPYIAQLRQHQKEISNGPLKTRISKYCKEVDEAILTIQYQARGIVFEMTGDDCPVTIKWMAENQMRALLGKTTLTEQDRPVLESQLKKLTSSKLFPPAALRAFRIYRLFDELYHGRNPRQSLAPRPTSSSRVLGPFRLQGFSIAQSTVLDLFRTIQVNLPPRSRLEAILHLGSGKKVVWFITAPPPTKDQKKPTLPELLGSALASARKQTSSTANDAVTRIEVRLVTGLGLPALE